MPINENDFAQAVSDREGKKEEVNIAQIKEVLKVALDILCRLPILEVVDLLEKHWEDLEKEAQKALDEEEGG